MSARSFAAAAVFAVLLTAGAAVRAQPQPEYSVACVGGAPVALSAGVLTYHTSGCQIGPGATDTFEFTAEAGAAVRITVASTSGVDLRVVLKNPAGGTVRDENCSAGPCSVTIVETPAAAGTYSVTVSDVGGDDTGTYVLQLDRLDPLYCAPVLTSGAGWGDALAPRTDGDAFRFEARSGDTVNVEIVSAGSLDPVLEIRDPSGNLIRSDNCTGPCTLSVTEGLSSEGTFTAWVSEFGADETGDYTITFDCLAGSCLGETVVDGLVFTVDDETLAWQPVADLNASYAVARGDLFALRAGGGFDAGAPDCLSGNVIATTANDPESPSSGAGFFYVTHAVGTDGFSDGYDSRWGPSQVCGRVTSVCDTRLGTDCSAPIPIASTPFIDSNNTCGAPAVAVDYGNVGLCNPAFYHGPELIYEIDLGAGSDVTATLTPDSGTDLGLFFVSDCSTPTSCVAFADEIGPGNVSTVSPGTLAAGTYYVYVDSFYVDPPLGCGDYTLEITRTEGPAPELLSFGFE